MIYLLVDTINAKNDALGDKGPFNKLVNELIRHLASTLPSLTIKTGNSARPSLAQAQASASSLGVAMENMLSGSPLLFLDLRERPSLKAEDREALITMAKTEYEKTCDTYLKQGLAETFDTMTIAYFHDVLFGDWDMNATVTRSEKMILERKFPLYEAIERAQEGKKTTFNGLLAPATVQQVRETAHWISNKFFSDAWEILPKHARDKAASEGKNDHSAYYKDNISAMSVHIRTIIQSQNFHHLNLSDMEGAAKLVLELVKLDRLPHETSLQGLQLLHSAWCEYDVAMFLASKYKFRSKVMFLIQLIVAWAVVAIGIARTSTDIAVFIPLQSIIGHVLFAMAITATLVSAFDSMLNAKVRWRQLRSSACALEAIIWSYRARVGRFQQATVNKALSEAELCDAINAWRVDLMSAADLQTTDLEKLYPAGVYKHNQLV